jgi:hypothetical protein
MNRQTRPPGRADAKQSIIHVVIELSSTRLSPFEAYNLRKSDDRKRVACYEFID